MDIGVVLKKQLANYYLLFLDLAWGKIALRSLNSRVGSMGWGLVHIIVPSLIIYFIGKVREISEKFALDRIISTYIDLPPYLDWPLS